jgi:hypothetical protein
MQGICLLHFCWLYSHLSLSKKTCNGLGNSAFRFDSSCPISITTAILQPNAFPCLPPTVPELPARILGRKSVPPVVHIKPNMLHLSQRPATPIGSVCPSFLGCNAPLLRSRNCGAHNILRLCASRHVSLALSLGLVSLPSCYALNTCLLSTACICMFRQFLVPQTIRTPFAAQFPP